MDEGTLEVFMKLGSKVIEGSVGVIVERLSKCYLFLQNSIDVDII